MKVVVARTLPAAGLDKLKERFEVEVGGLPFDPDWLLEHAPGASAIVADPTVPVGGELLDRAGSRLRVVANFAVGFDNIDTDAVRERGLRATNTPDVLMNATAELTVALMLAAGRRIVETDQIFRRGDWPGWEPEQYLGRELSGATVGLVGFGRIGQRVAALLAGFGARIVFSDAHPMPDAAARYGAERMELGELLAVSDYVSLHTVCVPHIGSATRVTRDAMAQLCADNVIAVLGGEEPLTAVV